VALVLIITIIRFIIIDLLLAVVSYTDARATSRALGVRRNVTRCRIARRSGGQPDVDVITMVTHDAVCRCVLLHYQHTIRYDTVYLTCSKKLTGNQLSPPHGTNKKLKCETKNKTHHQAPSLTYTVTTSSLIGTPNCPWRKLFIVLEGDRRVCAACTKRTCLK